MLESFSELVRQSGGWAYVIAPAVMIVVAIVPIPAEIPAVLNGLVFGAWVGSAITWSGALVGAIVSFELSRRYGRPLAARMLTAPALAKADRLVLSAGWPGLLTLRLLPTVAFHLINWGAGLTPVPRWTFLWTTAVGIAPGAVVFTVSGSGLGALSRRHPILAAALGALLVAAVAWTALRYRRAAQRAP